VETTIARGRKPLTARFAGYPSRRARTTRTVDQQPVMASTKRNELVHWLRAGRCELYPGEKDDAIQP
jgi:hypothetical protein